MRTIRNARRDAPLLPMAGKVDRTVPGPCCVLRKGCGDSEILGDPNSARAFGYVNHKECVPGRPAATKSRVIQWVYKLESRKEVEVPK